MANNLLPAKGVLGYSSRVTYAKSHKIPTAEQLKAMENKAVVSCIVFGGPKLNSFIMVADSNPLNCSQSLALLSHLRNWELVAFILSVPVV